MLAGLWVGELDELFPGCFDLIFCALTVLS